MLALVQVSGHHPPLALGLATLQVFLSGFAVMVLELIGARYLGKDFGSSFYVWTSQIGVVLLSLALGYYAGGAWADRGGSLKSLGWLLGVAGLATAFIPTYAACLIDAIVTRHPPEVPIALLWQKLDPALGSAVLFLLPCFALAALPPYLIRRTARELSQVGRTSGWIIAASTVGSIAGVFVSGYILIDLMRLSTIFRATGILMVLLGGLGWWMERTVRPAPRMAGAAPDTGHETSH